MTRRPNGKYLIESAPNYLEYLAAKAVREQGFLFWPLVMIAGALAGYESELRHALNAKTVYLGPGR